MIARLLCFLLAAFAADQAGAFPQLIRHGYVNCTTCHVSPSGGGVLNGYGRTFSGEGLSTWSQKGEEGLFHGLIKRDEVPDWLNVGGDLRGAQTALETSQVSQGHFYWMQADVEAAARSGNTTFDVSIGRFQTGAEEPRFKSRRFFAMYNFSNEWSVRAGRFIPNYGINLPDHVIATREPLGLGQGQERYNVEMNWITDLLSASVTASKGPVESSTPQQETALIGQVAYAFHDTFKIGANLWSGSGDTSARKMAGVFGLLGFTESLSLLSEVDWQSVAPNGAAEQKGVYNYDRLSYEAVHGLELLLTQEYWQTDLQDGLSATDRYGAGFEWYPRPHFDVQLLWTKMRLRSGDAAFVDYAWLMLHYYL